MCLYLVAKMSFNTVSASVQQLTEITDANFTFLYFS